MVQAGTDKAGLPARELLIKGFLSGALLAFSTSLAINAAGQTKPIVGALIFPVGFVLIILLGLELVTGNFALLPLAVKERKVSFASLLSAWALVFLGNLLGSVAYAGLLDLTLTMAGSAPAAGIAPTLVGIAEAKTTAYAAHGPAGLLTVFVKAILCNWMVCMGVVAAMTSSSTLGKIAAAWLPILIFFAQGFEHSVVNMFVIPAGMMLGAKVSLSDWWLWNQIPVTLGNIVGGAVFTGFALYFAYKPSRAEAAIAVEKEAPELETASA
jgi:formate/nitrite transporter